jgi:holo-[acyl-carrier protein] synthase
MMNDLSCAPATERAEGRFRIGSDLVEVAQVAESMERFGDRYLERVFTAAEIAYCARSPVTAASKFAARFAAKEAVVKVLRPDGWWPEWRSIEVVRHAEGWCDIRLHGSASELARSTNVQIVSCSLSHEGAYASAVVLGVSSHCST